MAFGFDPKSIMMYPVPAELTLGGFHTDWNAELSEQDKLHIASIYPKKGVSDVRGPDSGDSAPGSL